MRILCVLCRDPFSEEDGAIYAIRSSLRALSLKGDVLLTGFGSAFDQPLLEGFPCCGSLDEVTNSSFEFAAALAAGNSYSMKKYGSKRAVAKLAHILEQNQFDVVWYEQTQAVSAAYLSGRLRNRNRSGLDILRSHNIEHNVVLERADTLGRVTRPLLKLEAANLRKCELDIVNHMDAVLAITEEDRAVLVECCPRASQRLFHMPVAIPRTDKAAGRERDRDVVLFVGKSDWGPNLRATKWILNELAPRLQGARPDAVIRLVGAGTKSFRSQTHTTNIECAGYVDNLGVEYSRALCTIAPIWSGGGMNIKVLDSLAHGVPVVGTVFARRGISSPAYLTAESTEDFIQHICTLSDQPAVGRQLANAAQTRENVVGGMSFDVLWSKIIETERHID